MERKRLQQKKEEIDEVATLLWYVSDAVRRVVLETLRIGAKPPRHKDPIVDNNVIDIKKYI